MIIAQVGAQKPKTRQEIRMTTASGTVIQLMGSDEQWEFPAFPVVLAYNRINHYAPTVYLCNTSLADWRLAQMYRHLVCAGDFYAESQVGINDKVLEGHLVQLSSIMEKIKGNISERAQRGLYAASSVPISLTGPAPKRGDQLARQRKEPKSSKEILPQLTLPQPEFSLLPNCNMDTTCVPDIYEEDDTSVPPASSTSTSASGGVLSSISSTPDVIIEEVTQSTKKRKAQESASQRITSMSEKSGISEPPDNPRDETYVAPEEAEEEDKGDEGAQPTPSSQTQKESLSTGIPVGHKKRKVGKEKDPKIYKLVCPVCNDRFQRTNDLKDHNMVVHLGRFYDCVDCLTHYTSEKAMKAHFKTKHQGKGKVKCTEENCDWVSNDPGKLHNHLFKVHDIGDPIICKIQNSDGKVCGKVFINTRSFQAHKVIHQERNFECEMCNRLFTCEEHRSAHIRKYHNISQEDKFQCDICGKVMDLEIQLVNHKKVHKIHHHRLLQAAKKKAEKEKETPAPDSGAKQKDTAASTSSAEPATSEDRPLISHPSAGYDLESAMETLAQQDEDE